MTLRLEFVWRDLWIGVFVEKPTMVGDVWSQQTFICILPMLPIVLTRTWKVPPAWRI